MPSLFHTGMVVSDLEEVMHSMSEGLGVEWAEPWRASRAARTPVGDLPSDMLLTYSIGGEHQLELIQLIDNTAWGSVTGGPWLHHVGYWVDDLQRETDRLPPPLLEIVRNLACTQAQTPSINP